MDQRPHFTCQVDGCSKTFMRREHLTRHEKAHSGSLLTCKVCQRKFNRSDSLLRHLARHGPAFKVAPSGRSKRACENCRAGKIKCDGNEKCATCIRKNVACNYQLPQDHQDAEGGSSDNQLPKDVQDEGDGNMHNQLPTAETESLSLLSKANPIIPASIANSSIGLVDWTSVRVRNDSDNPRKPPCVGEQGMEEFAHSYFSHFHHRWPLIHRASHLDEADSQSMKSIIDVIGAWLVGSTESRKYATESHGNLLKDVQSRLCQVTFEDSFQGSLTNGLCQTALLCIILGIYRGETKILAQVSVVRNILISALRTVGFFSPNTAWADERPGYFVPMHIVKLEGRKRLAAYLLKVDSYLSVIQNQPAVLTIEECHFAPPSGYSAYNSDGLPVFEQRQAIESRFRTSKSLHAILRADEPESLIPPAVADMNMLIEDIQLCICGMWSTIWTVSKSDFNASDGDIGVVLRKDELRRRLDALKYRLDQFETADAYDTEMLERFYYGFGPETHPGWKNGIEHRIKTLILDAKMLYDLFSLHLLADIGSLSSLSKHRTLTAVEKLSERHRHLREHIKASIVLWARTPTARQAMCHVTSIIGGIKFNDVLNSTGDPIAHVALSAAALVIWGYCTYGPHRCDNCTELSASNHSKIDLTNWGINGNHPDKEKEMWVEEGHGMDAQIQGKQLCTCSVGSWMEVFKDLLPAGCQIADFIAPNLLKKSLS